MNIFRFAGDMTHLASVLVLLLKIHTIKSCAGVSLKTQELYAIVFATRYLDLFTTFISIYNTTLKLIFLGSSFSIVWYIRHHKTVRRSYDKQHDTFRHLFLIIPSLLLALVINDKFTFKEVMWTFSIYLEAVAILPQLVLLQRTRNIDNLTGQYVFLLGAYRAFYILNWIYRYFTEPHYVHSWISMICSHTILPLPLATILHLQCHRSHCAYQDNVSPIMHVYNNIVLLLVIRLQLGYRGLFRHCFMLISSIITSKVGRTTRNLSYQLDH